MEKKTKSFIKGAAILGFAGIIVKVVGALYRIPLANIVGDGMTFYDHAYPWYSWLLVISSAGLPTAISKIVAERVTLGDYKGAKEVFNYALRILLVIGVVTMLMMFAGADLFAKISYTDAERVQKLSLSFRALAPALLFVSLMCAYRGYLQGMQMMTGTAVSQVIEQVGKLIVGFTLAKAWLPKGVEYGAMGALLGVSASELMALIAIWIFYSTNKKKFAAQISVRGKFRPMGFKYVLSSLMRIAVPVTIGASIMPITSMIDSAMITRILESTGFTKSQSDGAFIVLRSYITPIINMPAVLTSALAMSLVPAISSRMTTRDAKGVIAASRMGMKLALIIGAPCAVGLFVLGRQIIAMLYSGLSEAQLNLAQDLMRTSSIGVLFLSLVQTMTGVIQGMGRPRVPVLNLIFGGILKVASMLILMNVKSVNIQGAAVSTVVCYAAAGILDTIYVLRKTGMRVNLWDVFIKPVFSSIIMGFIVALCYKLLSGSGHTVIATLASVAAGGAVYLLLAVVLKMFSPADLEFMPGGAKIRKLLYRR